MARRERCRPRRTGAGLLGRLIDALPDGPVAIDTAIVIYLMERNVRYVETLRPLFAAADRSEIRLVTSAITLMEVLVVPYRIGNAVLARRYEDLLSRARGLSLVELSRPVLRAAAHLRATHEIRTPDAIQLAAGLSEECGSFLTNDRRLPSLPGLPVLQLEQLLDSPPTRGPADGP